MKRELFGVLSVGSTKSQVMRRAQYVSDLGYATAAILTRPWRHKLAEGGTFPVGSWKCEHESLSKMEAKARNQLTQHSLSFFGMPI